MKHLFYLLTFFALAFFACEEISPIVTGSMPGDPTPVPPSEQKRQVLIEEFTGVRCVNCPNGSAAIEGLLNDHGQQLVAISIHAGIFSDPLTESQYDFRTSEGNNIINYLGQPFGFPSAVVNRRHFDGQFGLQLGANEWAGYINEELAIPPKVKIDIQPEFNAATRKATIDVTLFVEETINDPDVHLSVIFTESNIADYQVTPSGDNPNYNHKHVLRGTATPFDGIKLSEILTTGAIISKSFDYTVPVEWKEDDMRVIVLVSLAGSDKDVLQVHEVHLIE